MSRKSAFSLAYTHEKAFGSELPKAFSTPAGIPAAMQAILNQFDSARSANGRSIGERLEAINVLMEAEASDAKAAARSRS